jgi:hypothetical protein
MEIIHVAKKEILYACPTKKYHIYHDVKNSINLNKSHRNTHNPKFHVLMQ